MLQLRTEILKKQRLILFITYSLSYSKAIRRSRYKRKPKLLQKSFPEISSIYFLLRRNRNLSAAKPDKKLMIYLGFESCTKKQFPWDYFLVLLTAYVSTDCLILLISITIPVTTQIAVMKSIIQKLILRYFINKGRSFAFPRPFV